MAKKARSNPFYNQSKLLSEAKLKPVLLQLPKAHPKQYEFISYLANHPETRFVVGACGSKWGKASTLGTLVPSPTGWKTFGDIKEGDYVFDENGHPTRVEFVTDTMYGHKCYRVEFSDGTSVDVDAGHLWETETNAARKARSELSKGQDPDVYRRRKSTTKGPEVVTTQQIKDTLTVNTGGRQRPNHSIPVCGPVQYPAKDLKIDPYVLGVWLGDGTASNGSIACDEKETGVVEEVRATGYVVRKLKATHTWAVDGLAEQLRTYGFQNNKHVPLEYLQGSVEQRTALLQGLMDTDGTICKLGHCCFDNTNKNLADAVAELCCSLGIKVFRTERIGKVDGVAKKLCYRVKFTTDFPVFRLKRKLDRIRPVAEKNKRRYIVDVVDIPSEPVRCIRVASPRHLFLVGKSFIPTHNTYGSTIALTIEAWNNKDSLNWWVSPTFSQSKMAYNLIKRLLPEGFYTEYKADLKLVILGPDAKERSVIEFKSGDNPDSLRGFGVKFFVMDEAARCPYDSYVSLWTTVTQTMGRGFFISTPHARNWFYDIYQKGEKFFEDGTPKYGPDDVDENPEWFSIRMPTWQNPHVKLEAIEQLRRNLPEDVFRQEIGAQFLADSAGVFRGIKECVRGVLQEPMRDRDYVMGVDLGRLRDYTVLTVIDTQTMHVVAFERFNKISWEMQYSRITHLARKYRARAVMDSTGIGDPIVEAVQRAGVYVIPYKIGGSSAKQQLIDKLRVNIENQRISFPQIPILRKELESYEIEVGSGGTVKYSAPRGSHDDCVISLALANWGADQAPMIYRSYSSRGV